MLVGIVFLLMGLVCFLWPQHEQGSPRADTADRFFEEQRAAQAYPPAFHLRLQRGGAVVMMICGVALIVGQMWWR